MVNYSFVSQEYAHIFQGHWPWGQTPVASSDSLASTRHLEPGRYFDRASPSSVCTVVTNRLHRIVSPLHPWKLSLLCFPFFFFFNHRPCSFEYHQLLTVILQPLSSVRVRVTYRNERFINPMLNLMKRGFIKGSMQELWMKKKQMSHRVCVLW